MDINEANVISNSNEKVVLLNILAEKTKANMENNVADEYTEKVILFGYLIVSLLQ